MRERIKIIQHQKQFLLISILCLYSFIAFASTTFYKLNTEDVFKENSVYTSSFVDDVNYYSTKNVKNIQEASIDDVQKIRELAILHSNNNEPKEATDHIIKYLSLTADMSFINDHVFIKIKDSKEYLILKEKYKPRLSFVSVIYIYAGLLGFFIFLVLNFRKDIGKTSTLLISLFVLFHSLFILHLSLYRSNYQFYLPHSLFASTTFSFLYGPLLYFYFKKTIHNSKFKWIDLLHLIPSVALFIYILPFYMLTRIEKFNVIFNQDNLLLPGAYTIIIVKILSLCVYAYLIVKMYTASKRGASIKNKAVFLWQRNIIALFVIYVVAYMIYAASITGIIQIKALFHLQIIVMVSVVFYVAYIAYARPEIFRGKIKLVDPINLFKYKNSGLTPSYSNELKQQLMTLLEKDKIYKQNSISLEILSEKLGTTRHNTSQVINEHFDMNFFELMNKYRIGEAMQILKSDENNNLSIIQIAYEVGFNNKVSFNKSFKKYLSKTPTQYIKSVRA